MFVLLYQNFQVNGFIFDSTVAKDLFWAVYGLVSMSATIYTQCKGNRYVKFLNNLGSTFAYALIYNQTARRHSFMYQIFSNHCQKSVLSIVLFASCVVYAFIWDEYWYLCYGYVAYVFSYVFCCSWNHFTSCMDHCCLCCLAYIFACCAVVCGCYRFNSLTISFNSQIILARYSISILMTAICLSSSLNLLAFIWISLSIALLSLQ